ncbi:hypothetical protein C2S53_002797 [Perilla frutescens var. hirtella]|uniref:Uncharacterized protein n=1 Tax=Perilla frutescens var. hirtella TaxID=608512 RepID=A0AAD4IUQ3_PERFH|nr:hypothetical protein C2S53_002797 [Perilla frutescens var. hirtella]
MPGVSIDLNTTDPIDQTDRVQSVRCGEGSLNQYIEETIAAASPYTLSLSRVVPISDHLRSFSWRLSHRRLSTAVSWWPQLKLERTLIPSHEISTATTQIFKKYIDPDSVSWKSVPRATKEQYVEEYFRKLFTWEPCLDEVVHHLWFSKATKRYRDMIHTIKKNMNMNMKRLAYISLENRRSEPDGPGTGMITHKGESRYAVQHGDDLAQGLPEDQAEVYERAAKLSQPVPGTDEVSEMDMTILYLKTLGEWTRRSMGEQMGGRPLHRPKIWPPI